MGSIPNMTRLHGRRLYSRAAVLLVTLTLCSLFIMGFQTAEARTPAEWTSRSIYFILTDRFSNGDTSNDNYGGFNSNLSDPRSYHGGDFQGIINKLDYIKNMGFTAIWITPVTMQRSQNAYHGYWTYDFYSIDGHLGNMAKLQQLVQQAHNRNIWVMLDVVANHTGYYNYTSPTFPNYNNYHHNGDVQDYNNQYQVENYDVAGLNDINQDDPTARSTLLNNIQWLVNTTGVDGLRVDTVKHVGKTFWRDFDSSANTFTIGEVFNGDPGYVGDYSRYLDAVLDFPMNYTIKDVFARNYSMYNIKNRYNQDYNYRDPLTNGLFIDNHDISRFLCDASGAPGASWDKYPQLKMALSFIFSSRGIPIMYYGTEQGFGGCSDPYNREDMFNSFNTSSDLYQYVGKLNYARNLNPAVQNGGQYEKWVDDTFYAYERQKDWNNVVVAINNCFCSRTVSIPTLYGFSNGQTLHDEITGTGYQVFNNTLNITLSSHQAVILTNRY